MTDREQSEGREAMLAQLAASVERMSALERMGPPELMLSCRPDFEARAELEEWARELGVVVVLSKHVRPGLVFVLRNPGLS